MEKSELIAMLNEGLSVEEIPTTSTIVELKEMVGGSDLGDDIKKKLNERIGTLLKDTIRHSKIFSDLIREQAGKK